MTHKQNQTNTGQDSKRRDNNTGRNSDERGTVRENLVSRTNQHPGKLKTDYEKGVGTDGNHADYRLLGRLLHTYCHKTPECEDHDGSDRQKKRKEVDRTYRNKPHWVRSC